jgi:hypothetical protein
VPGEVEQAREGVAEGRVPTPSSGQRPGRVGGHELHQHALPLGHRARAEAIPGREHGGGGLAMPAIGQEHVEESGASHLDPVRLRPEAARQLLA